MLTHVSLALLLSKNVHDRSCPRLLQPRDPTMRLAVRFSSALRHTVLGDGQNNPCCVLPIQTTSSSGTVGAQSRQESDSILPKRRPQRRRWLGC